MHDRVGLEDNTWIDNIAGPQSRFAFVEAEVCADYSGMEALRKKSFEEGKDSYVSRVGRRMKTIADEQTLNFLSRKAIIPEVWISGGCRRARYSSQGR